MASAEARVISAEVGTAVDHTGAVLRLLAEGHAIPYIARYRGGEIGGLAADKLREINRAHEVYTATESKRQKVKAALTKAGHRIDGRLEAALASARTVAEVEEVYGPYKPDAKRTKAAAARALGLGPAADAVLSGKPIDWREWAQCGTREVVAAGVQHIVAEAVSVDPESRQLTRQAYSRHGILTSQSIQLKKDKAAEGKAAKKGKGKDKDEAGDRKRKRDDEKAESRPQSHNSYGHYADFQMPVWKIRHHQVLAIDRGEKEKTLTVAVGLSSEHEKERVVSAIARLWRQRTHHSTRSLVDDAVKDAYTRLLSRRAVRECRRELTQKAHAAATKVFARNVRAVLLTRPTRGSRVCAIDPGFRNGCKIAVLSETGQVLETCTLFPHGSPRKADEELVALERLVARHKCDLIGIGNGTAVRETEEWVGRLRARQPGLAWTIVNEAGASIYSVSPEAEAEMPDRTPAERGAISLGRRLLDPLSELVKVEAKHLGVGMYQHDLSTKLITTTFDEVIEECVALVGVDLNTADEAVLRHVPGLHKATAKALVQERAKVGRFSEREDLKKVPGVGKRRYQDAVGFTRVYPAPGTSTSISKRAMFAKTGIHPDSYGLADALLAKTGLKHRDMGSEVARSKLRGIDVRAFAEELGTDRLTLRQIVTEMEVDQTYDPRSAFSKPLFRESVRSLSSVKPGMVLSGRVENVSDFGAFVDVGLERSGLVHVSQMVAPLEPGDVGDFTCVRVDLRNRKLDLSARKSRADVAPTSRHEDEDRRKQRKTHHRT